MQAWRYVSKELSLEIRHHKIEEAWTGSRWDDKATHKDQEIISGNLPVGTVNFVSSLCIISR